MGLIKAAAGAGGGVLADQWKEYFYCDAINADVLAVKGRKKVTKRSSNTKGDEDIITSGSVIAVADGQAMMIVDQGKVVEAAFEPGEFVYDSSAEPTIFAGSFGDSVCKMFANMAKRFTFGGEAPRTQRVYYFNTKELTGNKYGTASPVPFRVLDERAGIDMDIGLRCFGEYSYRIVNPMLFYTNVCGNMAEEYRRENLDSQLKSELLTALQPAFARIGANGVRYSALPAHTMEIADALNEQLSSKWRELRGIEIVSFGVNSVKADEEDEKTIKEMQREAAYRDPTRAAGSLVHAQAEAMKSAAANANAGPAMAFMGMNMAGQAGGASVQNLYAMGQQQAQAASGRARADRPATPENSAWAAAGPSPSRTAGNAFAVRSIPANSVPNAENPDRRIRPGRARAARSIRESSARSAVRRSRICKNDRRFNVYRGVRAPALRIHFKNKK